MRLFRRRTTDPEINAELRYHLDQLIAMYRREGLSWDAARRQALIEFGAVEPTKEACRDLRPFSGLAVLIADVRYAVRRFRGAPGFTTIAVLSLALGIGANTALFSLVNAALLRLIPVERPDELAWFGVEPDEFGRTLNYPFFESIQGDPRFSGVLCAFPVSLNMRAGNQATERIEAELVSGTYFPTLGLRPHLGRLLSPDDDRVRLGHPVVVVSHSYWQSRLGADPNVVGREMTVNGAPYTLIGVAPPGFSGIEQGYPRSAFFPMKMKPAITPGWDGLDKPHIAWLWIVGRVKPGVDWRALEHEMDVRLHALQEPYIQADKRLTASQLEVIRRRHVRFVTLGDATLSARVRRHLRMLGFLVAALLLMTCANLAGLLLARGLERQRELATRLSIGASRSRIIAQLLTESLLLGLAGGTAGLALGASIAPVLATRFPLAGQGSELRIALDTTVIFFSLGVSILASLAFGITPAWQSTRLDLISSLKGSTQGMRHLRLRHALLAGQVAMALLLLIVAGLFSTNLRRVLAHDTGFANRHLLIAEMEPMLLGYSDEQRLALYRRLDERLWAETQRPGSVITQAALSNVAPVSQYYWTSLFLIEGRADGREIVPRAIAVGPEYFVTMRIPLRRGRLLTERDDRQSPRVAVISESLAQRAFPDSDPIGRRFVADTRKREESTFEIAGVVADVDLSDPRRRRDRVCVYMPYRQVPFVPQSVVIHARLSNAAAAPAAIATLRAAVNEVDPKLAIYDVRTIETALDRMLVNERLATVLTVFFAGLAALLVAIGLYGILVREVVSRTREIGIRLALGAPHGSLLWLLLRATLVSVGFGVLIGTLLLMLAGPGLATLLVDVHPMDPAVMGAALAFLLAVALVAALLPGRKATRVDPATALRWD
jgi:predicted permease